MINILNLRILITWRFVCYATYIFKSGIKTVTIFWKLYMKCVLFLVKLRWPKNKTLHHFLFLCRVFELNPQIKKMMPEFMTADPIAELNSSRKLFGHSKTLMKCLENAVTSLDDNEGFVAYLVELGRRHQVRPLKAQYLEVSNVRITRISTHCLSL